MTLFEQYESGDRGRVWDEIHELGPLSGVAPEVCCDVERVARRTIERAAANVRTIHGRLVEIGYRFDLPDDALVPPNAETAATKARLAEAVGPLPATLNAWFDYAGYASFRGSPPAWSGPRRWYDELFDPFEFVYDSLMIASALEMVEDNPELYRADDGVTIFPLEFAGDFFHKNDFSGGGPTYAALPSADADARVFEDNGARYVDWTDSEPGDEHGIWFVDYLRRYFRNGGFRRVRPDGACPAGFFASLSHGLLEV